ncbi:MAG: hypothetical protein M1379_12395 [Firmicutes bacterium]|nr:hypothetical protein [Bacillota bacterium]
MNPSVEIRRIDAASQKSGKSGICDKILRALPEWFGIEKAIITWGLEEDWSKKRWNF